MESIYSISEWGSKHIENQGFHVINVSLSMVQCSQRGMGHPTIFKRTTSSLAVPLDLGTQSQLAWQSLPQIHWNQHFKSCEGPKFWDAKGQYVCSVSAFFTNGSVFQHQCRARSRLLNQITTVQRCRGTKSGNWWPPRQPYWSPQPRCALLSLIYRLFILILLDVEQHPMEKVQHLHRLGRIRMNQAEGYLASGPFWYPLDLIDLIFAPWEIST